MRTVSSMLKKWGIVAGDISTVDGVQIPTGPLHFFAILMKEL